MLIAMAGLPATGKSTIAARLAEEPGGVILSKDRVRAALFPSPVLDYSSEQNDLTMDAITKPLRTSVRPSRSRPSSFDGRTFLRSYQIRDLFAWRHRCKRLRASLSVSARKRSPGSDWSHDLVSGSTRRRTGPMPFT
jgi:hypothetical protein